MKDPAEKTRTAAKDLVPRSPVTPQEWESYYDLRWRVLRAPWDQPRRSERDQKDETGFHLMLGSREAIAGGRLDLNSPSEAQVRYMAVDPEYHRKGLGSTILQGLEAEARRLGANTIILNSRESVVPFYERHGYRLAGSAPLLFGQIAHFRMEKEIT